MADPYKSFNSDLLWNDREVAPARLPNDSTYDDVDRRMGRAFSQRLALWALGTTCKEPVVYSGPIYQSDKINGGEVNVKFTHVGTGLAGDADGRVQGFAGAGADRKFYWANAAAIQGDAVIVSSAQVSQPVAVRYAWKDSPICNLHNKEGLPASPFRTDDWPGITQRHLN